METSMIIEALGTETMKMMLNIMLVTKTARILTSSNLIFKGTSRHQRNFLRKSKKKSRAHGILNSRTIGVTWLRLIKT
jgi:hypothetical protein